MDWKISHSLANICLFPVIPLAICLLNNLFGIFPLNTTNVDYFVVDKLKFH